MPTNSRKNRDLSRLGLVGSAEAGAAWQSLVQTSDLPGERLEGARELPIALIEPFSDQPRKHFDSERLVSLANSIGEDGVIQPIVVRPHPTQGGRYLIVAGERRFRAAGLAGLTTIPAIISDDADEEATARRMLRENTEREDLDIEDLGSYLQALHDTGMSQRELADLTHFSLGKVNGLLKLAKHPDLLEQIRNGLLTQQQALDLLSGHQPVQESTPTRSPQVPDAALSEYRPLARLASWARTFKPQKVPVGQRPLVRAHLQEAIDELVALYDALGDEAHDSKPPASSATRGGTGRRR